MTSTILYSSPVSHHLSAAHKFPNPYSIQKDQGICIDNVANKSNEIFNRTLSSIIRNNQVIESIGRDEIQTLVTKIEEPKITLTSTGSSSNHSEKDSFDTSRTSSTNEHNNDTNSEQFNNSVSSTSSFSNNSQSMNKSQKSKKKVQFISNENLNTSNETAPESNTSSPKTDKSVHNPNTSNYSTNYSILIKPDKPSTLTEAKKILTQTSYKSQTIPYNYYTNVTNINTSRNSVSNYSSNSLSANSHSSNNNYCSFRNAESRLNSLIYHSSRNQNRYSAYTYTPSYSYRLDNRHKHYSLRSYPTNTSMKTSITLPAISNTNLNTPYQKSSFSSYAISDCDNPFRPEGELAKEAEEFVQQLKEKKEQEVAEIINTKTSSSNINPDASVEEKTIEETVPALAQSPSQVSNDRKSSDQADNVVVVNTPKTETPTETTTPTEPQTPATNVKLKKNKTKAKCGCSIS